MDKAKMIVNKVIRRMASDCCTQNGTNTDINEIKVKNKKDSVPIVR